MTPTAKPKLTFDSLGMKRAGGVDRVDYGRHPEVNHATMITRLGLWIRWQRRRMGLTMQPPTYYWPYATAANAHRIQPRWLGFKS